MKRLTMRLDDGRAVMRCEECKEGRNGVAGEGCTAMYCRNMCKDRLAAYEDTGLTPAEVSALVKDWSDLCTIVGECGGIDRLRELAEAGRDGRLVVLPFTSGRTLLSKENIESPRLMKDVEPAIRYCSSCGIVFHMGYNVFCDLVKHGRITAVSEEAEKALAAEKALEAMKNE